MKNLSTFINRLNKINIKLVLVGNYPWIYIDKINNVKVSEKYMSDYAFTIGYYPIRLNQEFSFTDLKEIFNLIRKYK